MGNSLSPSARALLEAARTDAPRAAARAEIWGGVSSATGIVSAAGGASVVATTAASGKLLLVGVLLGSALTAGFGYAVARGVTRTAPPGMRPPRMDGVSAVVDDARREGVRTDARWETPSTKVEPRPRSSPAGSVVAGSELGCAQPRLYELDPKDPRPAGAEGADAVVIPSAGNWGADKGVGSSARGGPHPESLTSRRAGREDDALGREAALVAEASSAVRRGDAEAALATLDAARRIGSLRMEPEELSIRARALRRLGRESEATETEVALRTKYPDHFLAR